MVDAAACARFRGERAAGDGGGQALCAGGGGPRNGAPRGHTAAPRRYAPEDFATLLGKLRGMVRDGELPLHGYTVMSNHGPLLFQDPRAGTLLQ